MHEMGIAASVLDIVGRYVPAADAGLVRAVRVRVGDVAGVQPDSLCFCFEAIVAGTPYHLARLEIDHVRGADLSVAEVELADADPAENTQVLS